MTLRVLSVASEVFPLVKTGGLADVAGALPGALASEDVAVTTLVPGYPAVLHKLEAPHLVHDLGDLFGGRVRLVRGTAAGLDVVAVDAPHLYDRPGGLYADASGREFGDNAFRFAALGYAAAEIGLGYAAGLAPDVVHAHDWQAGLAPAYLHYRGGRRPGTVFTVHNLAFQGQVPAWLLEALRLPVSAYSVEGVEYYGSIGFLKAGLRLADRITTVSPTYAEEILSPEAGMGLDGLLRARARDLVGIVNVIDTRVWDPGADPLIPARFTADDLDAREGNRAALRDRFRLEDDPRAPVVGVVSRLSWQKGLDVLAEAVPDLLALGGRLVLLGSGDPPLEAAFRDAAAANPGRIGVVFGYDEALAHLVQAGSDMILVPSRFEPCGLTQLCALRYGAPPVVVRVGGLADTVIDASPVAVQRGAATGFQFAPLSRERLAAALARAVAAFADGETWRALQRSAMATDVSWAAPARAYARLYADIAPRA